tara:strand:- start:1322 stop:1552 length:231 start_codon:yes stop_codon:yes gene_type:complete
MGYFKLTVLIFVYLLSSVSNANAYIDPGTGSIILQAILAFVAGAAATVSLWWGNLKMFIKKIFKSNKKDNETNLKP